MYIAPAPSVSTGLVTVNIPGYGNIQIPKAVMDRINYDLNVSNQRSTPWQEAFQGNFRGYNPKAGLTNVSYAGLEPYLQKLSTIYSQPKMNTADDRLGKAYQQYESQFVRTPQQVKQTGLAAGTRYTKQTVDASGRITSPQVKPVDYSEITRLQQEQKKKEKDLQRQLMVDKQRLEQIGSTYTASNVPVKTTLVNPKPMADVDQRLATIQREQQIKRV